MNLFEPGQPAPQDPYAIAIRVLRDLASSFEQQAAIWAHTNEVWITYRRCADQAEVVADELDKQRRKQQ